MGLSECTLRSDVFFDAQCRWCVVTKTFLKNIDGKTHDQHHQCTLHVIHEEFECKHQDKPISKIFK